MTPRQSKASTAANVALVELVRHHFKDSPMNRAELAVRSGIPEGTIAGILAGTKPLYAEQIVGLAVALNISLEEVQRVTLAAQGHSDPQ